MCLVLSACSAQGDESSPFGAASGASGASAAESGSADAATAGDTATAGGTATAGDTASTSGSGSGGTPDDSEDATDGSSGSFGSSGASGTTGEDTSETESGDSASGSGGSGDSDSDSESTGETPLSDDPFDPASCDGVAWTGAEALAELGGLPRSALASATIQVRTRSCTGDDCGPWGLGEDWIISYLTWSGGVVTAYTDLEAAMNLVLFDDDGVARLSMQHETFGVGGYPGDDGVLYGFPPEVVNYPHLRAYNQFPESEYYYIDLDYQVAQGELVLGEGCAVWTANPFGTGQPYTAQYGVVFHW